MVSQRTIPGVSPLQHTFSTWIREPLEVGSGKFSEAELFSDILVVNNTYKAVRVISADYNLYYSVWCTNEHELYDLTVCRDRSNCSTSVYCGFY